MKAETEILHTHIDVSGAKPNCTPLFQASSFLAGSDYFYSRKSNPNCVELEAVLCCLENAKHAVVVSSGMAAIHQVLALLKPGDHLIANRLIYGCTYRQLIDFCQHYSITLDFVDLTDLATLPSKISAKTRMIFFETPTNPLLKTVEIAEVRRTAPNALVVVDNTWATPYFQKPLELGADVCVVSATKFYAGHSDCMAGVVSTNNDELAETFRKQRFYSGAVLDPHSAWLIRRSMQTFAIRMREHQRKISLMASYLVARPEIQKVYLPEVDGLQLKGYGCILFFEFKDQYSEKVGEFMRALKLFDYGTSMASVVSSVAHPVTGSHLSMTDEERSTAGIKPSLVRLCFGLEDEADLMSDLNQALSGL